LEGYKINKIRPLQTAYTLTSYLFMEIIVPAPRTICPFVPEMIKQLFFIQIEPDTHDFH
jgi:hypothetical protein